MKNVSLVLIGAALCGGLLTGCTSVESTQKFNAIGLGTADEKAVCLAYVEIPGYYFFGLPIITGSAMGDGSMSVFMDNLKAEHAIHLLTSEAKRRGAARMVEVQIGRSEQTIGPFVTKSVMFASGVGVRTKAQAVKQAQTQFELEP